MADTASALGATKIEIYSGIETGWTAATIAFNGQILYEKQENFPLVMAWLLYYLSLRNLKRISEKTLSEC